MSQATNVNNINFSTAFLTDKICGIRSNTFTAGAFNVAGYLYQTSVAHNLTRPAFMDGIFSANGSTYVNSGTSDGTNSYIVYSDASNYYLLTTANSGVIDYKIVATWIDNYDATNPLITPVFDATLPSVNNTTNFDSRQNYQKIFKENLITVNNPGAGNLGSVPINHGFGYTPNYKIYFESLPGQMWPSISGGTQDIWLYDTVHQYECWGVMDTSNLTINYLSGSSSAATLKIFYRIYYDS